MAKKIKHCVFILDQTGSMSSLKGDTIGGFNEFLKKQKRITKFDVRFTLVLFDSVEVEKRYAGVPVAKVKPLDEKNYKPRGLTPLFDAIGVGIAENDSKKDVFFIILTDGFENYSSEYTREQIRSLIEKKTKAGWGFQYLGVGLDKFSDAFVNSGRTMGIRASSSSTFPTSAVRGIVGQSMSAQADNYYETGKLKEKK